MIALPGAAKVKSIKSSAKKKGTRQKVRDQGEAETPAVRPVKLVNRGRIKATSKRLLKE